MATIKVGDTITVRITSTTLRAMPAIVTRIDHGCVYYTYQGGMFDGLCGMLRREAR